MDALKNYFGVACLFTTCKIVPYLHVLRASVVSFSVLEKIKICSIGLLWMPERQLLCAQFPCIPFVCCIILHTLADNQSCCFYDHATQLVNNCKPTMQYTMHVHACLACRVRTRLALCMLTAKIGCCVEHVLPRDFQSMDLIFQPNRRLQNLQVKETVIDS